MSCFSSKEQKSNLRKIREGLEMKKNEKKKEKSDLKGQKSTWFCLQWAAPAEAGDGRWCLGPWSQRLAGEGTGGGWVFLERNLRGWQDFFGEIY